MNIVLAAMKKVDVLKKLISFDKTHERALFKKPQDIESNSREFECSYKLEDDEWYKIEEFSSKEYCLDFLKNPINSTQYVDISIKELSNIKYIVSYQPNAFYFQRVYAKNLLVKKSMFEVSLNGNISFKEGGNLVILNSIPDAFYDVRKDTLYFKNFRCIKGIFPGIEILYREATVEEVAEFLSSKFIRLNGGYCVEKVKEMNRKRIAEIKDSWEGISLADKAKILNYTCEYCPNIPYDDGIFTISNEAQLKELLFGLDERYYTTTVSKEKRVANSVKRL